MTLFDDKHCNCPARLHDGTSYTCSMLDEKQMLDTGCHEVNCPVYFWIEQFAERVKVGIYG